MAADDLSAAGLRGNTPFHIADLVVTADHAARRVVLEVHDPDADDGVEIAMPADQAFEVALKIVAAIAKLRRIER
jgi:hypothetical protein